MAESEAEIAQLAQTYGIPERWKRVYAFTNAKSFWVKKMLKRRGEVVLVVPGSVNRIWLHTKQFYPHDIYRLPSGGIHQGEAVELAVYRESFEELGEKPEIVRFIGLVENEFVLGAESAIYPTYAFLTQPITTKPQVNDPSEAISGFKEIEIGDLSQISRQLDSLDSDWQPWGHFRAAPHAMVMQVLNGQAAWNRHGG